MAFDLFLDIRGSTAKVKGDFDRLKNSMSSVGRATDKTSNSFAKARANTSKMSQSLRGLNVDANRSANSMNEMAKGMGKLNGAINVGLMYQLGKGFATVAQSAFDMIETTNLFNVSMGETAVQANELVTEMSSLYGLDPTNLQSAIGTFNLLARSMGISSNSAETLSTNTAKLALDLSSLMNVPITQVMADLRSGLVGQSETVYKYGIDVTEASLKQEAMNQGISKSVRNMSQGEKMALRYATMIRQTSLAQGDFARTIDTPANQLKILGERFVTLSRTIGSIFVPILGAVLPYLNAFVTVLNKLLGNVATFFGFVKPEVKNTKSGFAGVAEEADGIGGSIDGATESAKKMKKALKDVSLGIDELNVISPPTTDAGAGAGGAGDMAGGMLNMDLPSYNNMMDTITSKSDKLAESMMLGLKRFADFVSPTTDAFGRLVDAMKPLETFAYFGLLDFYNEFLKPVGTWVFGDGLPRLFDALAQGVRDVNLFPLVNGLRDFWIALTPFAINVGSGLVWLFENALVPLGVWTMNEVVPQFLGILTEGLNGLNAVIEIFKPAFKYLWDNFLQPIASWTGGVIVAVLDSIKNTLQALAEVATENKTTVIGALNAITDVFSSLWNGILEPIFSKIINVIKEIYDKHFKDLFDALSDLVTSIISALAPIVTWLLDFLGKYLVPFVTGVIGIVGGLLSKVIGIITGMIEAFAGLITFLTGIFTGDFDKVIKGLGMIFKGFGNIAISVINLVIAGAEALINVLIKGVNYLIEKINILLEGMSDVLDFVGIDMSFTVPTFESVKFGRLPQLARGGALSSGQLFEAGENGKAEALGSYGGKTTVMPLENTDFVNAIYEAVLSAMTDADGNGTVIENVVNLDGEVIYNNQQKVARNRGVDFNMGSFAR